MATGGPPLSPPLPPLVVPLVSCSSLGGVYLSIYQGAPCVGSIWHFQGLGKTWLVALSGEPQPALPSQLVPAGVSVKFLARGACLVTVLLK